MIHSLLSKDCKITQVENSAAAGTTTLTSDILDMQGYDGVIFIADLGDVTDTSVLTLTGLVNATNDTTTPTSLANTATFTAGASDADHKLLFVDVGPGSFTQTDRYAYCTLARATANAVVDGIIAIQYRARSLPVTQGSTVLASAINP